jgi:hypothetical protein
LGVAACVFRNSAKYANEDNVIGIDRRTGRLSLAMIGRSIGVWSRRSLLAMLQRLLRLPMF